MKMKSIRTSMVGDDVGDDDDVGDVDEVGDNVGDAEIPSQVTGSGLPVHSLASLQHETTAELKLW